MNIAQFIKSIYKELPFFLAVPAVLWQVLFFYCPLFALLYIGFCKTALLQLIISSSYIWTVTKSTLLAFCNAVTCLLCGYPIAYYLALHVQKWKNILLFLILLPFWSGMLVLIHAWFFLLEKHGLINMILLKSGIISQPLLLLNNTPAIALVMLYCYLPFMIMPIYTVLEKIDRRLLEASFDLGASHWTTMLKITLPLSMPGIKTGFFLVLVPSFGEFVIPELIGGNKQFFIGSLISYYFLEAQNPIVGAACTSLSLFIFGIVILALYRVSKKYLWNI